MSVIFGAICLDCLEFGPDIGGYGYIGYPSLSKDEMAIPTKWDKGSVSDHERNFGFIYTGLEAFKMLTYEVEAFNAFLIKHHDHRIIKYCDHADEFPPEMDVDDEDNYKNFKFQDDKFITAGYYEVFCETCGSTHRSQLGDSMKIRPFDPFVITPEQLFLFKKHVLMNVKNRYYYDNFEKHPYLLDPYDELDPLKDFLYTHENHKMLIRLSDNDEPEESQLIELGDNDSLNLNHKSDEFMKRYSTYKIATILAVATVVGGIVFGSNFVSHTGLAGTLMAGFLFLFLPLIWVLFRFLLLKCSVCHKSFFLYRSVPKSCPRCNSILISNKFSKAQQRH
jgi:uncharacterized membrane protein YkgB